MKPSIIYYKIVLVDGFPVVISNYYFDKYELIPDAPVFMRPDVALYWLNINYNNNELIKPEEIIVWVN